MPAPESVISISRLWPSCVARSASRTGHFSVVLHCFDRIDQEIQEQLLKLIRIPRYPRIRSTIRARDLDALLKKLATEERKGFFDWLDDINRTEGLMRRHSEAPKSRHKLINSLDFLQNDRGEIFAEILLSKALGQELRECSNRHKRVLDFVGYTGSKGAKRGQSFTPSLLAFEILEPAQIAEDDNCAKNGSCLILQRRTSHRPLELRGPRRRPAPIPVAFVAAHPQCCF